MADPEQDFGFAWRVDKTAGNIEGADAA